MVQTLLAASETSRIKSIRSHSPENEVIRYISKFMYLSETDAAAILDHLQYRTYKKGDILLREGQYSNLCYFNLKGCVRQYYIVDGEERTTNFYTEGQPISPGEGNFKKLPSKFYLSCVEDTILTMGTPEDEIAFMQKFPKFEVVCRVAVEEELGKSQDNFATYMLSSPEKRYLNLLKTRPELLDRVPQYQLASYLGIKPESLSRIRKRIMVK